MKVPLRRVAMIIVLGGVVIAALAASAAALGGWDVFAITDDATPDISPDISGSRVVYEKLDPPGSSLGDSEVFLYDMDDGSTVRLTSDKWDDTDPQIDGHLIAWVKHAESGGDIFVRDLTGSGNLRLTSDAVEDTDPRVSADNTNSLVVWKHGSAEIRLYEAHSGQSLSLSSALSFSQVSAPRVDHGTIVWSGIETGETDEEIYLYDLDPPFPRPNLVQVTDNAVRDIFPETDGSFITWMQEAGTRYDVYYTDVATLALTQASEAGSDNLYPHVNEGYVAWSGIPFLESDFEVFVCKTSNDQTRRITWNDGDDLGATTDLDWVSWITPDQGLALYNIRSEGTTVVTPDSVLVLHDPLESPLAMDADEVAFVQKTGLTPAFYEIGVAVPVGHGSSTTVPPSTTTSQATTTTTLPPTTTTSSTTTSTTSTTEAPPAFTDVPADHPYHDAIIDLAERGIIVGYQMPDGTYQFRPQAPVWRAQFAKMIVESLDIPVDEAMTSPFVDLGVDVTDELFPHEYVAAAFGEGIVKGLDATHFGPYQEISRAQVVTMVVRAVQSTDPGLLTTPPVGYQGSLGMFDADHGPTMRLAEYNGLLAELQGFGPAWDPWASMTRGEVAQVLENMLLMKED